MDWTAVASGANWALFFSSVVQCFKGGVDGQLDLRVHTPGRSRRDDLRPFCTPKRTNIIQRIHRSRYCTYLPFITIYNKQKIENIKVLFLFPFLFKIRIWSGTSIFCAYELRLGETQRRSHHWRIQGTVKLVLLSWKEEEEELYGVLSRLGFFFFFF